MCKLVESLKCRDYVLICVATAAFTFAGLCLREDITVYGLMAGFILPAGVALCYFLAANRYFKECESSFDASALALNSIIFILLLAIGLSLYIEHGDRTRADIMAVHLMACIVVSISLSYVGINLIATKTKIFKPLEFRFISIELNYMAGIFTILAFISLLDPNGYANDFISYMGGCTCLLDFMTGHVWHGKS